jgi:hypothetical protein
MNVLSILTNNENPLVRAGRALLIGAISVAITAVANAIASGDLAVPAEATWLVPLVTSALLGLDKWLRSRTA